MVFGWNCRPRDRLALSSVKTREKPAPDFPTASSTASSGAFHEVCRISEKRGWAPTQTSSATTFPLCQQVAVGSLAARWSTWWGGEREWLRYCGAVGDIDHSSSCVRAAAVLKLLLSGVALLFMALVANWCTANWACIIPWAVYDGRKRDFLCSHSSHAVLHCRQKYRPSLLYLFFQVRFSSSSHLMQWFPHPPICVSAVMGAPGLMLCKCIWSPFSLSRCSCFPTPFLHAHACPSL